MQTRDLIVRIATVAVTALLTGAGDYFAKHFSLTPGYRWFILALVAYSVSGAFWMLMVNQFQNLLQAGTIWMLATFLPLILISQVCFHETLTATQWCGMILGTIALLLML